MDYEKTFNIAGKMMTHSPIRAFLISLLLYKWLEAKNWQKEECEKKIRNLIIKDFLNSLNKSSRNSYSDCNTEIQEEIHKIEVIEPYWVITSWGAERFDSINGEIKAVEVIPREYKKGFILQDNSSDKAKQSSDKAKQFAERRKEKLEYISELMDEREIILKRYKTKKGIPKSYTEELIDWLGYRRTEDSIIYSGNSKKR